MSARWLALVALVGCGNSTFSSVDAGSDGTSASDASSADPGIACGDASCKVGAQVCCIEANSAKCTAFGACGGAGRSPVACDDPADCIDPNANVCCLYYYSSTMFNARCGARVDCAGGNASELCDPSARTACPDGGTCAILPFGVEGLSYCR